MVPRQEHLGDAPSLPVGGPGVVGVVEPRPREGILADRSGIAHDPRHLPDHRVGHHHRRELAARQHVVADRNLVGREGLDHAHNKRNVAEYEGAIDVDTSTVEGVIRVGRDVETRLRALGPVKPAP